ncbi:MAG: orotidine-5'-phosphate decarboxylase [Anaerolineales bacterium]
MESFFKALEKRVRSVDSLLCVGLDPHPDDLAEPSGSAARDFCLRLVEETIDSAAAYKPNAAFFEALGPEGLQALKEVIDRIPDGIPVILDIKRGDISSTARAYAQAAFDTLGADAVTINPYLGRDAVQPFIANPARGAFVLCKTSNPGAADLQDLPLGVDQGAGGMILLYQQVADLVRDWNNADNLGLVIGATQIEALQKVRERDPGIWFLAPGVGAQGGDLEAALKAGLRDDGLGMLIPISRGISRAEDPGQAARDFKAAINLGRASFSKRSTPIAGALSREQREIAEGLLQLGCIQFGEFTLKSGRTSPIYLDLRRLIAYPPFLKQVARAYSTLLEGLEFDHLAALPYAGLPITSAICSLGGWPMVYPRKEEKDYGTKALVEGVFSAGQTALVIDDLITTGGSKLEGITKLLENGLVVRDIAVLIDRSRDAASYLKQRGYRLHTYLTLSELLDHYLAGGDISEDLNREVRQFLENE